MFKNSIAELSQALADKTISSVELTNHYLDRIQRLDKKLNAFISVDEDAALMRARQADNLRAKGEAGPLTGIPIAHKDIFCTQGVKTSCGSKMLDNFIAPYDATVVEKCNHAGLVMLGKTNMDEFAMGSSNENSFYGPVKNPWNLQRVPGGSSGGSAAAVAARLAPLATGTDTGGSIRQPSALCGITGIKPTYGRVSRYGMVAFASSLDQAGPMAHSAEDCAFILQAMAGFDVRDSTSANEPVPNYRDTLNYSLKNIKIGIPQEFFSKDLDPKIATTIQTAIKVFEKLGAHTKAISMPNSAEAIAAYYIIAPAECSSNLARFDGVRYGFRCENPKNLEDLYKRTRGEGFGSEVKRRILMGTYVLSAGYYDAYYLQAQKVRRLIKNDYQHAFKEVDVIFSPTAPSVAFAIGDKVEDPISMYLSDIFTVSTNLAGLPGISIPAGFVDDLPVGLQMIGNYFQEAKLLNLAHVYQQETDWHRQIPAEFN